MSFCCTLENKQNPSHVSAKQNAVKTFLLDKVRFSLPPSPRSLKPLLNESPTPNIAALRKQRSSVKFRASKHPDPASVSTNPAGASAALASRPDAKHITVSSGGENLKS